MAPYHIVLVHFPVALCLTATLAILVRAVSDSGFAKACDRALVPLLGVSVIVGALAYLAGLFVWPFEALSATPLGRNHLLAVTWSLVYWLLVMITRWRVGEAIWEGPGRWIMAGVAVLGAGLLSVAGTLGGHLVGTATAVSQLLRLLGWEVYTTFYVPDATLAVIALAAVVLVAIGLWASRRPVTSALQPKVAGAQPRAAE